MKSDDSERLDEGKAVPFSMAGLIQVLMQVPSAPAVQTAKPQGLGCKLQWRGLSGHGKLSKQGHQLVTFGG